MLGRVTRHRLPPGAACRSRDSCFVAVHTFSLPRWRVHAHELLRANVHRTYDKITAIGYSSTCHPRITIERVMRERENRGDRREEREKLSNVVDCILRASLRVKESLIFIGFLLYFVVSRLKVFSRGVRKVSFVLLTNNVRATVCDLHGVTRLWSIPRKLRNTYDFQKILSESVSEILLFEVHFCVIYRSLKFVAEKWKWSWTWRRVWAFVYIYFIKISFESLKIKNSKLVVQILTILIVLVSMKGTDNNPPNMIYWIGQKIIAQMFYSV